MNTYTIERDGATFTVKLAGEPGVGGHVITGFPSEGVLRDWLQGMAGIQVHGALPIGESRAYP